MGNKNITIALSDNGGFVITVTGQGVPERVPGNPQLGGYRQKLFTATTIDEAMILVREQLEVLKA